jgi:hypothetical protein
MRDARYQFEVGKRYLTWVVAVKLVELPSRTRAYTLLKVTLATPGLRVEDSPDLAFSERMEAVLWLDPKDPKDWQFIKDAGVIEDGDRYLLRERVALWCEFGPPSGRYKFQPLTDAYPALDGTYRFGSLKLSDRDSLGLEIRADETAHRDGKSAELTAQEYQVLRRLNERYPGRASLLQLKEAVTGWDNLTEDHTVAVVVSELKKKLEPLGVSLSRRKGIDGWRLIPLPDKSR